ncbi:MULTISPECIES: cytochrome c [unclassified Flavobacterium]|uniref:c-type cytochrome n=1 Tax=unclassified Flavobacterium TaxID=196869 RepID=UPI0012914F90|nr:MULTISPECIES: cytochrome c [unclassified Flavobacterium]MQP53574.1 cytochrome c [Flavobacterium sp. LMO9]MQP63477.1 cytochrome c [Flavobacterium sp. LMO6]
MKIKLFSIAFVLAVFYACSPKVIQPEVPKVDDAPIVIEAPLTAELAEGKLLFESNCAKCHDLYSPKDFNAEQWKPIMLRMQKEAKISDEEREMIYAYLTK